MIPKYSASFMAERDKRSWHSSALINAKTLSEACQKADQAVQIFYPPEEGFTLQHVCVQEAVIIDNPQKEQFVFVKLS